MSHPDDKNLRDSDARDSENSEESSKLIDQVKITKIDPKNGIDDITPIDTPGTTKSFYLDRILEDEDAINEAATQNTPLPSKVGRYLIRKLLGRGSFGEVYLGSDELLKRDVAIKLTYGKSVGLPFVNMFLSEAQILAELDHPNIVPVFDIGTTNRGDFYIVSKLIEGCDLAGRVKQKRPTRIESLNIVAAIADALHYAHSRGLIHRDVKPSNILLDTNGKPYLADFGLALRETDQIETGVLAGTPAYMSPEQLRGEGHLVTNLSDIYSLGVVLYELLTGRLPFRADSTAELIRKLQLSDVRSPRVFDASICSNLERICLKALSKRPSDRYVIANDFASDIRDSLESKLEIGTNLPIAPDQVTDQLRATPKSVIPKGARSFDQLDADFFLELLPGPFDRTGLPESIWFWKTRIESPLIDHTFRVGLIYGPSGCGKTSLMKAGLLPKLLNSVEPIYLEATPNSTERQLLALIHERIPPTTGDDLIKSLNRIRRHKLVPNSGKLLIVIDQFEQWLSANGNSSDAELTNAIRQCDGTTVQVILLLRDDFWVSGCRFFREIDIPIIERHNSMMVDLFDLDHAKKVLRAYGFAYQKIEDVASSQKEEQDRFIDRSIKELSQDGKVIPMRLSLFAEMVKGRTWNLETLDSLGGISGLGVAFLQQSFASRYSPIQYREHQSAVRNVLAELLPPLGSDIKGVSKTARQLRESSGYESSETAFAKLIAILCNELKIITPTDSVGEEVSYQLTHDYLVPSIRDWLNQKKLETAQGRAELKLQERASIWSAFKEKKQLPTFFEWLQIKNWTLESKWSLSESEMMNRANRLHYSRLINASMITLALCLSTVAYLSWKSIQTNLREDSLLQNLKSSEIENVPTVLEKIAEHRPRINPKLANALDAAISGSREQINLSLAMVGRSPQAFEILKATLPQADVDALPVLIRSLKPFSGNLVEDYWNISMAKDPDTLLQTASALASYDPSSENWSEISEQVVDQMVKQDPVRIGTWIESLRPVKQHLIPSLTKKFMALEERKDQGEIELSTDILNIFVEDLSTMHELVLRGTPRQFSKLFPRFQTHRPVVLEKLRQYLSSDGTSESTNSKVPSDGQSEVDFGTIFPKANAAVALLRLGDSKSVYEFLTVDENPDNLSQFIFSIRGRIHDPSILLDSLRELQSRSLATDDRKAKQQQCNRIYAMLLGLAEFDVNQLPSDQRQPILDALLEQYKHHPSRTIHSATGWLLRRWGQGKLARQVDQTPLEYDATGEREWFVIKLNIPERSPDDRKDTQLLRGESSDSPDAIYFTMIVFPSGEYRMGRFFEQKQVSVQGPLAVSDREVTEGQYFGIMDSRHEFHAEWDETDDLRVFSANNVNWFEAIEYCRRITEAISPGETQQCYLPKQFKILDPNLPNSFVFPDASEDWPLIPNRSGFRLPTNEEWEYFARGGTTTKYSFGESYGLVFEYGSFSSLTGEAFRSSKESKPSITGLFEIHGGVSEWTSDTVKSYPGGRWIRGATHANFVGFARSDLGLSELASKTDTRIGFRVVMNPEANGPGTETKKSN